MPVTVVVARQTDVTERLPVVGSLAAREEVQVYSSVQGQAIEQILVEVGQHVAKGEALAVLDMTVARMLLDKNSVSIMRAKTAVSVEASRLDVALVSEAEARKILERSRALQPKGAVSQQVLDEHQNAHARAVAELGLARQSLALAEADAELVARERKEIELTIERSTVRAPEAGLVLKRTARIGAMTSGSADPLFVIARDAVMEFVAQVTETSFVRLQEGMRAVVTLPGRDRPIGGTLRLSAAQLDPATRSGEVRIELDDDQGLRPGVFARGSINASSRNNILLPGSAVKTSSGQNSVFIVKDGVVGVRKVTVGARQDGFVEIVGGVSDGEMIVLKSGGFLKTQERVRPVITASDRPLAGNMAAHLQTTDHEGTLQ
ncbi:efflux RND transporter periplasmic adaptor subunit [Rhizobium sp. LCM 4573]|uniref:efflux RND transporter periplasmic adaptor subunit n=1 Tax=Rhizobium sp. LCM 4573 TaxID=1848291 RepID=UPI0008D90177|nr:efflux RND transporter periplasmic adaptor subunit [Rhizobium sp. LCM 4573]OHV77253.1 efflux transporter periplasmic adaptor subunit [Rhizobium sp. LCM 4573]